MKSKNIFLVMFAAIALVSCNKNYLPISDHPFDITTSKLESSRVIVDVVPDNNDFYYMFDVAQAEQFEKMGVNAFVEVVDSEWKSTYRALYETDSLLKKFPEWLYRGAYDQAQHGLDANTRYIAYAFPYNDTIPVVEKFTKVYFSTLESIVSDNKFTVSVNGSEISITPSNDDSYFFDYCTYEELSDYYFSLSYFYEKTIDIYWEYGFLDELLEKGSTKDDIKDYYPKTADGDQYYFAISGYDKGISTKISLYRITVHFGQEQSIIEPLDPVTSGNH